MRTETELITKMDRAMAEHQAALAAYHLARVDTSDPQLLITHVARVTATMDVWKACYRDLWRATWGRTVQP